MMAEAIGYAATFDSRGRSRTSSPQIHREIMVKGFSYIADGYAGIERFLEQSDRKLVSVLEGSPGKIYGAFYIFLHERVRSAELEPIARFVAEHAALKYCVGPEDRFLGMNVPRRNHSARSAAAHYNVPRHTIRTVLHALGRIQADKKMRFSHEVPIPVDDPEFDGHMRAIKKGFPAEHGARRLGVNVGTALQIADRHFEPLVVPGLAPLLDAESVENFMKSIVEKSLPYPGENFVNLRTACLKSYRSICEILELILDGRLREFSFMGNEASPNLGDMLIDAIKLTEITRVPPPGRSVTQAAKFLRTPIPTMSKLLESGLIEHFLAEDPEAALPAALHQYRRSREVRVRLHQAPRHQVESCTGRKAFGPCGLRNSPSLRRNPTKPEKRIHVDILRTRRPFANLAAQ